MSKDSVGSATAGGAPRVLVISQVPPPHHGSTVMTRVLLGVLAERSTVTLLDRRFSSNVAEVGRFRLRKVLAVVALVVRFVRAVRETSPTVCVFFITNRPGSFLVDCFLAELLRVARIPVLSYVHTQGFQSLSERGWIWKRLVARLLRLSQRTVCLSPSLAADVTPWVDPDTIVCIPNTPDAVPRTVQRESLATDAVRVLFFSNLLAEKGPAVFVAMAVELCSKIPSCEFFIAGASASAVETSTLHEMVAVSEFAERIHFLGSVSSVQKWALLSSTDLLVFPSTYRYEAQPLAIIESLAMGTPVVAFSTGAIPDIFTAHLAGIVLEKGNEGALTEVVRDLIKDPTRLSGMRVDAKALFEEKFSRRAYSDAWGQLMDESKKENSV